MSEVESELRELFERKASEVLAPVGAPAALLRRGRRRQIGNVALSAFTVLAVVVGSVAGLKGVLRGTSSTHLGGGNESFTRTATIRGFTVTSPSDWTLIDEWPLASQIATTSSSKTCTVGQAGNQLCSPTSPQSYAPISAPAGLPVFQLSNFDPGLDRSLCGSGSLPSDGGALYVAYNTDSLRIPGDLSLRSWPINLGSVAHGPCGDGQYARFLVGGHPYFAFAEFGANVTGADRQEIIDAFRGLNPQPVELARSPDQTPGYVIAGGEHPGGPWRIEARPYAHGVNLELIEGEKRVTAGDVTLSAGLVFAAENAEPRFGVVTTEATSIEFRPTGGGSPIEGTIVALPRGLGADENAFYIEGVGNIPGAILAIGPDGRPLGGKAEAAAGSSTAAAPSPAPTGGNAGPQTGVVIDTGHDLGAAWTLRAGHDGTAVCITLGVSGSDTSPPSCALSNYVTTEALVPIVHRIHKGALLAGTVPTSTGAISVRATVKVTGEMVVRGLVPGSQEDGVDFFVVPVAAPGLVTFDFLDANGNTVLSTGFRWGSATAVASPS